MAGEADNAGIGAHIRSIDERPDEDAVRITRLLHAQCWPGGSDDRTHPGALEWVRRWRPGRGFPLFPSCACAHGACSVCN